MTTGGWIIMISSVTAVTVFFGWTLYLVLAKEKDPDAIHSMMDETPDMEEEPGEE